MKVTKNGITLDIAKEQLKAFEDLGYEEVGKKKAEKGSDPDGKNPIGDKKE